MPTLPSIGGGQQIGDGNTSEPQLFIQPAPTSYASATVAITAAAIATGILLMGASSGAITATLPTAAAMDALFTNAKVNSSVDFAVIGTSTAGADDTTVTTNTGWTLVGNMFVASNAATTDQSAAQFRARKTADAAWTLYRLA